MVASGALIPDGQQAAVVERLDMLLAELRAYGIVVEDYRGSVLEYQVIVRTQL